MLDTSTPILNDEEKALLEGRPEECLRRAVARSALSLDQVAAGLPPHVATAVRGIVTGERPPAPGQHPAPPPARDEGRGDLRWLQARIDRGEWQRLERKRTAEAAHDCLGLAYPSLDRLLADELLTPDEAMEAAHSVDAALGRYTTGTRYAAP